VKAKMTISLLGVLAATSLFAAGCGGGSSASTASNTSASAAGKSQSTQGREAGAGAAPSEAQAAATGDIPDNQVFLVFHDPSAGYSIRYPEGWARKGSGNDVTFEEKANVIHVSVRKGAPRGKPEVKTTYTRLSAPDPVTGKRLKLVIDRYEYGNKGKVAVLDLATPEGVDNVDAYRLISESFKWR
jgi:hypothetical protein